MSDDVVKKIPEKKETDVENGVVFSVKEKGLHETPKHNTLSSHQLQKEMFDVGRAFDGNHVDRGTIVTDRKRRRASTGSMLKTAWTEWWNKTRASVEGSLEKIESAPVFKKEEPSFLRPTETREKIITEAATHTQQAPKDDHIHVVEKIRTMARDASTATGSTIAVRDPAPKTQPTWESQRETAKEDTKHDEHFAPVPEKEHRHSLFGHLFLPKKTKTDTAHTFVTAPTIVRNEIDLREKEKSEDNTTKSKQATVPQQKVEGNERDTSAASTSPASPQPSTVTSVPTSVAAPQPAPKAPTLPASPPIPKPVPTPITVREVPHIVLHEVTPENIPLPPLPQDGVREIPNEVVTRVPLPTMEALPDIPPDPPQQQNIRIPEENEKEVLEHEIKTVSSSLSTVPQQYTDKLVPTLRLPLARFIRIGSIIIAGCALGISTALIVSQSRSTDNGQQSVATILPTHTSLVLRDASTTISLSNDRDALLNTLISAQNSSREGVTEFLLTDTNGHPVSIYTFFETLATQIPNVLVRSLKPAYTIGSIQNTKGSHFMVLHMPDYDTGLGSMLSWERTMSTDLSPLFGEPVTLTHTPKEARGARDAYFIDAVTLNTPVRILYDEYGEERIVYAFVNKEYLIITSTTESLDTLIEKLNIP